MRTSFGDYLGRDRVPVADLNRVLAGFPSLDDDAESFAADVERIRSELRLESDPWA